MHVAKSSARKVGLFRIGAALAVLAATLCASSGSAQAQGLGQSPALGALRLGVFAPVDSNTRAAYGNYMWDGGLDYTFQQSGTSTRDLISVDYIQEGAGANNLQMIPVTIGQQYLTSPHAGGVRPYAGYGVGIYIMKLRQPGNTNFADNANANGTNLGGYVSVGLDLNTTLFVDARYNYVGALKDVSADGFQVTAGVRF